MTIEKIEENRLSNSAGQETVQAKVVEAIADWCEALHGNVSLNEAVAQLVGGLGAEAGVLVRTNLSENRSIRVALYDKLASSSSLPLEHSFGDELFGPLLKKTRPATIWMASRHTERLAEEMALDFCRWQEGRKMKEFAVLVLASGQSTRDHLELHFREPLSQPVRAALRIVLPAMARTWASRQVGLVTRSVVNRRISSQSGLGASTSRAMLSTENPARLSRAEFRVCLLLSRGLSVAGVRTELSLADATVRSHLRNIYSKSDTSSLAELVYCLIKPEARYDEISAISA
jgi:DNA-binding NarL/FixJ family response regulator